jgi:hypothetical protein
MAYFVEAGGKYINVEHVTAVYTGESDLTIYYAVTNEGVVDQTYLEGEEAATFKSWLQANAEVAE